MSSKKDVVLKINNISVCFDGFYALTEVKTSVERIPFISL